ncbi:MAG: DUF3726 domain-containing protein [Rhodospirillaceae bacterium]|nr:DUF3726 domain-containing protein [Rhodospirillaceae bacterium]MDD9917937.1 DUF3726 domain-containing protein [Rhodospirillaceae bacterium]MDD9927286.1 DUF3726 domain-containing protein [Rhodospirillaceae bacterium]
MSFALNEIEATANKAARGAGLDWGIAEEAGKAVRWLAARGLPGPELLAQTLKRNQGLAHVVLAPKTTDRTWAAPGGRLCPLIAGAALTDCAHEVLSGRDLRLDRTSFPLLLVPFAAACGKATEVVIEVSWAGAALTIASGTELYIDGEESNPPETGWVQCRRVADVPTVATEPETSRCSVGVSAWDELNEFAHRTYAPATEESRERGAG